MQGVVLVVASLGPLWNSTQEMGQEGLFDVYVVDGRGHLVAHSDPKRLSGDLDVSDVEIVRQFLRVPAAAPAPPCPSSSTRPKGTVQDARHLRLRPRHRLGRHRPGRGRDKAYYSAIQMGWPVAGAGGLVTIAAIVLRHPVRGADQPAHPRPRRAGARRLAGGEYATRVDVKASNEVGELADAFNPWATRSRSRSRRSCARPRVNKAAVHGLHPHARQRHRREGPLHPRPLRAGRLLLDA